MTPRRFASIAGTVAVTGIAAIASYDHMRELAERAGQPTLLAALLPLSVDGMVLVATLALGDGRRDKRVPWAAFVLGVAASVWANVAVAEPTLTARVVSAWPAVALLLTVEILVRSGRPTAVRPAPAVATNAGQPVRPAPAVAMPPARPAWVTVPPGVRPLPLVANTPAVVGARRGRSAAVAGGTAGRLAALLADRPDATVADVAAALGVAERTARRHLAAMRPAKRPARRPAVATA